MDDKWAEETAKKFSNYASVSEIINALLEAERRGFERGVNASASICESFPFLADLELDCGCIPNTEYAKQILKLKQV